MVYQVLPRAPSLPASSTGVVSQGLVQEVFLKHRRMNTCRRSVELQSVTASVCAVQDKATGHVFVRYNAPASDQ